jgi:hypothetical protein
MIGRLLFLTAFLMTVSPQYIFAETLKSLPATTAPMKAMDSKTADPPCANIQYNYKSFNPETALPFPPGAFVEIETCNDPELPEKPRSLEEESQREAVRKLSLLLGAIYRQQENLEGSYRDSDQAYQELLSRKISNPEGYDQAVSNYEDALGNYGEYEAYLSVLPRAVSEYENKTGSFFRNVVFHKEDGAITMMKSPARIDPASYDLKVNTKDAATALKAPGKLQSEREKEPKGNRQEGCAFMGAFAGAGVTENIVLVAMSNPMGILLGATLGATLCSEPVYQKLAGLQKKLGEGLVEMASYVKDGLGEIGKGLYRWGKDHLYQPPSNTGAIIAEHYENTRDWLNQKLGWQ